ncbi:hypothetical protein Tco_1169890 [Tanacetum coccineum]
MVPLNNLGPDHSGKAVNETQYRGMIGSLMYLKGTSSLGLWYPKCSSFDLKGYTDSDYAGWNMDRKSTSGACQLLGGKLMCWSAKKQQSVAMSSAEAEYVPILYDNTSAIAISNNPVLHSRTKHIDIRYHFIRDHILKGDIELHFIPTQYQLADIFTSLCLDEPTFKRLIVKLDHQNSEYFHIVSDFISKCGPKEAFTRALTQYVKYLAEFWYTSKTLEDSKIWVSTPTGGEKTGGLDQISNKDATILYCLANGVKVDYAKLIWEDIINKLNKKTKEKVFSVHNWELKPNQTEGPPFTDHMKAICKKPRAKSGLKRKQSSKHTSDSKTEASKSKIGQSVKDTQSSSAKDKTSGHPSPPTPVVGEMHKETQQAAGGPTSLGATSEEGAHPQLNSGHDASVNSTAEADAGNSAPNDSIPLQ